MNYLFSFRLVIIHLNFNEKIWLSDHFLVLLDFTDYSSYPWQFYFDDFIHY